MSKYPSEAPLFRRSGTYHRQIVEAVDIAEDAPGVIRYWDPDAYSCAWPYRWNGHYYSALEPLTEYAREIWEEAKARSGDA